MKQATVFAAITAAIGLWTASAWAETPLVQEGKHTVYQRVISHPKARLYVQPSTSSAVKGMPRTFTSFYVYERKNGMLRVGVSATKSDGWLPLSSTTDWPQAVTMVFTDQMGRAPVLFFRNHEEVLKACEADSIRDYVGKLADKVVSGQKLPTDFPVIAAEPQGKSGQVASGSFYLLPVLNIDNQFKDSGAELLEVACLDPGNMNAEKESAPKQKTQPDMSMGFAFVIDTTISMGPYIEKAKQMIRGIFDELQKSPAKDRFAVSVVAFRSSVAERPNTEYTTRIVSDFKSVKNREELEDLLSGLNEATASTHAFDEDSFAGVKDAVDQLSWDKYSSRAMLLLTDAGPLLAGDPTSKTGMSAEGMADYLRTNKVSLMAVHVKTPAGRRDHANAEKNYRVLSRLSNGRSSYIAINAPNPAEGTKQFEKVGRTVASTYRELLEKTTRGETIAKPELKPEKKLSPEQEAKRLAELTGYAMQLQFLGDRQKTAAPEVKRAWIADTDLAALEANPDEAPVPAVYPAVLLTKTQLSQLRKQLKTIIQTAEEAFLQDSENFNFYEQLVSAAAQMSRDPTQFVADPSANLARRGVLLEVLDGLPYKSRILGMQKDDWVNMSTGDQQEFIKRLKGLIARYDEYDRDSTHWEGFGSDNVNEWVYRVPLNMLP